MKMKNRSLRYGINRPRPRHRHNIVNIKVFQYQDAYMY